MPKPKKPSLKQQPNAFAATRDVIKHAINKKVTLSVGMMGLFALLTYNLSSEHKFHFLIRTIEIIDHYNNHGWFFLIIFLLFWNFQRKLIEKEHLREVDRIGLEKTWLQEKLVGKPLTSSSNADEEVRRNAD